MRAAMRKCGVIFLIAILIVGNGNFLREKEVLAATRSEDLGFEFDENLFRVNWGETKKIYVEQTARSLNSAFDKGVTLGYARVYAGFVTSKKKIDGKYYQRVLVSANMVPQTVSGKNKGMSQYLTVRVANGKYMKHKRIEPASTSGATSYSTTGSIGLNKSLGVSVDSKGKLTVDGGREFSLGITSSASWEEGALIVTTNVDDNGWGVWEYDYVSSKNKSQNAYLFGSSNQKGLYSWNMKKNGDTIYSELSFSVTATFGGGNVSSNSRATNTFASGKYNLGSNTKTITIKHKR